MPPRKRTNKKAKYISVNTIDTNIDANAPTSITVDTNIDANASTSITVDTPNIDNISQELLKSLRTGYGHSAGSRPLFNNNSNSFHDFHNQLKHYLLINGLYQHIKAQDISESMTWHYILG